MMENRREQDFSRPFRTSFMHFGVLNWRVHFRTGRQKIARRLSRAICFELYHRLSERPEDEDEDDEDDLSLLPLPAPSLRFDELPEPDLLSLSVDDLFLLSVSCWLVGIVLSFCLVKVPWLV